MRNLMILSWLLAGLVTNAQVSVSWVNYPGGVSVATDASNNVYTADWDYNPAGDITVTKRDALGAVLWQVPYNNTNTSRHEVATWIDTDSQGNVIVSGTIRSGYSNPVNANSLLMKFSPAGNLVWRVVYETDFDGSSTKKILVDSQDNIYVLGLGNSGTGMVTKVKKFSPSGTAIWSYFDNAGIGAPVNFKLTADNKIIISCRGITGSINGYSKIDLDGNLIWSIAGISSLTVGDAAGDSFGNSYLINGDYAVSSTGSILKKISPSGAVVWEKTHAMAGFRVEVGTDNNPVISGFPNSGTAGAAFMKYDANGNMLWQNLDADGTGYNLLSHAHMKLDVSNSAYLAASTMFQMAVCKVNSDGTPAWTATTSGSYAYAIDFDTENNVLVAGGTTAKLSQSGGTVTVPSVPSNLSATAVSATAINLSWTDNSADENNFVLQRSLSAGSNFVTIATLAANTTTYSNTGLNSSTTYYYRVQANNSAGSSDWSNTAFATTQPAATPPAAPSNLTAAVSGCNKIVLKWSDNSGNEDNFQVSRSLTSNGIYTIIATLPANTITYTNTGLTKGKKYFYKVRSGNTAGNSTWSNIANATAKCPPNWTTGYVQTDSFSIKVYPNPAAGGYFNLALPQETQFPVIVRMYSASGLMVMSKELNDYDTTISTSEFVNGLYFLTVYNQGEVTNMKLIVKN